MPRVTDLVEVGLSPLQAKHLGAQPINGDFNNLSATGNASQVNAYQIEANYNIFGTVGASTNSAKLPKAESDPHGVYFILNSGANALNLYPAVNNSFNDLAVNTAISIPVNGGVILVKQTITSWQSHHTSGATSFDPAIYVPYTGATANLNLGANSITASNFSGSSSGTNTGNQTITLTSDVTGTGTGSFATTIANNAVTLAKQADMATSSLVYRKTAGTGDPEINTLATLKTDLGLTGTNSGDVTLAGAPTYLTLAGQVITRALIELTSHVTGILPVANGGTGGSTSLVTRHGGTYADGVFSTASTSTVNVTTSDVSVTVATGDIVQITIDGLYSHSDLGGGAAMLLRRDSTNITNEYIYRAFRANTSGLDSSFSITYSEAPSAGTYTYRLGLRTISGTVYANIRGITILVIKTT